MDDDSLKQCATCKQLKPRSEYIRRKGPRDGLLYWCKACHAERTRAYRANRSPERVRLDAEYDARRYRENKPRLNAQSRLFREANKPLIRARCAAWRDANPDVAKAVSQAAQHRRRAAERKGMGGRALAEWKRQQKKVCYWCAKACAKDFVVDHYQPLSKGGKHEISNLVIACRPCNARKSAKDPIAFAHSVGRLL